MKNSFFSKFTPKEPKFFPLLKQLSDVLSASPFYLLKVWNMICPQKEQITTNKLKTWNVKVTD